MALHDEIGYWSEMKLGIVSKYVDAYSQILAKQSNLHPVYVDAFAGSGHHVSRASGELVDGSPIRALLAKAPFEEYFFIDIDPEKAQHLRDTLGQNATVSVLEGDCNEILVNDVFPKVQWQDYKRALCFLDPYGLHLKWNVLHIAGSMKSVEIFLNFSIMDANMNALRRHPDATTPSQAARMTSFWGDDSWKAAAYCPRDWLFEDEDEKNPNEAIVRGLRTRLQESAGFEFVPEPIPMRNSIGAVVYYLFFAGHNRTGARIATDIFKSYRNRGRH